MTAAAAQRIMDIAKALPDEAEGPVINFMVKFKRTEQPKVDVSRRIGIAEGRFKAPEDFDANNEEVYSMIMESASKL